MPSSSPIAREPHMAKDPEAPRSTGPVVSVCIANYNGEDLLQGCIDSVLDQELDAELEIIVHDDASLDGSVALLERDYPQVRLIRSEENVGFCIANNRMVAVASGEFILLLNNDAALLPDAIDTLLAAWKSRGDAILTLPQYDWENGRLVSMGNRLDLFYNVVHVREPGRHTLATVDGACLFIEKALWDRIGGFPEYFGSIAEDALLCCAARLGGTQIACPPSSGYRHRQGASFGGSRLADGRLATRYRRRYLSERNRIALLASCTPGGIAWPWLVAHLGLFVLEGMVLTLLLRSREPWSRIYAPALRDAWRHRRTTRQLRGRIQSLRRTGVVQYLRAFTCMPQRLRLFIRHGLPRLSP